MIIAHSSECWDHDTFKDYVLKSANTECYYRAINFYISEHPDKMNELLVELSAKLDHARVVSTVRVRMYHSGSSLLVVIVHFSQTLIHTQ